MTKQENVNFVPQSQISFDAAWGSDKTQNILDILKEDDVKATFFLVGMWVDKYPEIPIVLSGSKTYGPESSMPSNPVEGQLYFVVE